MRVLFATHFFPPAQEGGTETYTLGLAKHVRRLGHEPAVICAENWGQGNSWTPSYRDTTHADLAVRRLSWNWELAPDPFTNLYNNPAVEKQLDAYIAEVRPDVIHITSCYSLGAGVIHSARRSGVPVVLTLTDFWFLSPRQTLARTDGTLCPGPTSATTCARCMASESGFYRSLTRRVPRSVVDQGFARAAKWPLLARQRGLRGYTGDVQSRAAYLRSAFDLVDAAIAPSRALQEIFIRNGYPSDRLRVSRYGLDTSWLGEMREVPSAGRLRIGYIGQVEPIKGVDLLVNAFRSLGDVGAELKIFGSMTKNPQFGERLRDLAGDHPAIVFAGAFDRTQVAEVFSQLDVVVVPSVWFENAPVVIAEAFAAGKPVICTDLAGMTELVEHDVNGLVFGVGDEDELARQLRRCIIEPGLLDRLRGGIGPVRTIDEEARTLVTLYRSLQELAPHSRRNPISTSA
jgi:glycosyltransferase involved in cell wall biosynthesis